LVSGSWPISQRVKAVNGEWVDHEKQSGHFYLAESGHFYSAVTRLLELSSDVRFPAKLKCPL
jgi:hypothetical protein